MKFIFPCIAILLFASACTLSKPGVMERAKAAMSYTELEAWDEKFYDERFYIEDTPIEELEAEFKAIHERNKKLGVKEAE